MKSQLCIPQFAFVGYAGVNGNIYRVLNGVDDCGFICGRDNKDNGLAQCKVSQYSYIFVISSDKL